MASNRTVGEREMWDLIRQEEERVRRLHEQISDKQGINVSNMQDGRIALDSGMQFNKNRDRSVSGLFDTKHSTPVNKGQLKPTQASDNDTDYEDMDNPSGLDPLLDDGLIKLSSDKKKEPVDDQTSLSEFEYMRHIYAKMCELRSMAEKLAILYDDLLDKRGMALQRNSIEKADTTIKDQRLGSFQKKIKSRNEMMGNQEIEVLERLEVFKEQKAELLRKDRDRNEQALEDELLQEKRLKCLYEKEDVLTEMIREMHNQKTTPAVPRYTERERRFTFDVSEHMQHHGKPSLPTFSGSGFEQWKLEVHNIMQSGLYSDQLLTQAVRNSLKGHTRQILLTIDPTSSTAQILDTLEEVYGYTILHEFIYARQAERETVSDWGLRLESILQLGIDKGELFTERRDEMLKQRFWRGLKNEDIKNATRVCYNSTDGFDAVRRRARLEEEEIKRSLNSGRDTESKTQTTTDKKLISMMKELMDRLKQLEGKVDKMNNPSKRVTSTGRCFNVLFRSRRR